LSCTLFFAACLTSLSFLCCTADALASANARIASLEAELSASQKAFDAATAAKANAEKLHKTALAKAKKAEKALVDTNKEQLQREQAVAERLLLVHTHLVLFFYCCSFLILADISLSCLFICSPLLYRAYQGIFVDSAAGR
jgi:hypothetical protein